MKVAFHCTAEWDKNLHNNLKMSSMLVHIRSFALKVMRQ